MRPIVTTSAVSRWRTPHSFSLLPSRETAPEAVHGDVVALEPSQDHQQRHVRHRLAGFTTWEHIARILLSCGVQQSQTLARTRTERHAVFASPFHPPTRHGPHCGVQVELCPFGAQEFGRPQRGQDQQFKRQGESTRC